MGSVYSVATLYYSCVYLCLGARRSVLELVLGLKARPCSAASGPDNTTGDKQHKVAFRAPAQKADVPVIAALQQAQARRRENDSRCQLNRCCGTRVTAAAGKMTEIGATEKADSWE